MYCIMHMIERMFMYIFMHSCSNPLINIMYFIENLLLRSRSGGLVCRIVSSGRGRATRGRGTREARRAAGQIYRGVIQSRFIRS